MIIFTNILDCSSSRIPQNELDGLNVTVTTLSELGEDTNLKIEYICNDGYDMLYKGDFAYECHRDGTWSNSNVPQCVNG